MQASKTEIQQIINADYDARLLRQIELEEEARSAGKASYYKAAEKRGTSDSVPGSALIRQVVLPLAHALDAWVADVTGAKGGPRRNAASVRFITQLKSEDAAFIATRVLLDMAADSAKKTSTIMTIARTIHDEYEFLRFKEFNKGLFDWSMNHNKKYSDARMARFVGLMTKRRAGLADDKWSEEELLRVGTVMYELAKSIHVRVDGQSVPLYEEFLQTEGQKTVAHIKLSEQTVAWIAGFNEFCALKAPLHMPMIVPPNRWESMHDGGYFTFRTTLLKTTNRAYLEELNNNPAYTKTLRDAVNALQETPWAINKAVLKVFDELWTDNGGGIVGLPPADNYPLPAKPHDIETNKEALKAWKRKAGEVHEVNAKLKSKRKATAQKLMLAKKFAEEPAIFFPHNADWRGRLYPMVAQLHPQGDDVAKGLLTFAEGKRLGENGVAWLKIHLANCFGVDKVSYQERIDWTESHHAEILEAAMFPTTGTSWWMDSDAPFQFLAACYDYMGYCMDGDDHISYLPIGLDGACNGIQHLSALLKDEVGGHAVALIGADTPSDIYSDVAKMALKFIREDAAGGDEAAKWLLSQNYNRKWTKSNVMTRSYGSTHQGRKDQLEDFLLKNYPGLDKGFRMSVASYASKVNTRAIDEVVKAASVVMKWLQDASRVMSALDMPISWTTPAGLPILQRYLAKTGTSVEVHVNGVRTKFSLTKTDSNKMDKRKVANALSPNVIHSYDSAHLMMTIMRARERGVTSFAAVHDSYGTHAADLTELSVVLREVFVEMYSIDRLAAFRDELLQQYPDAQLPALPAMGNLDITEVLDSDYFFA